MDLPVLDRVFDGAVVCAALQFFDRRQTEHLLGDLSRIVRPHGHVVFADVADADRIWNFYHGWSGRIRLAIETIGGRPTIGCWRSPEDLKRLGALTGWSVHIAQQPASAPNHYFRYDAVLTRGH